MPRITSQAFQDYNEEMAKRSGCPAPGLSVCIASLLEEQANPPEFLLEQFKGYGLASILGKQVRSLDQGIVHWPTDNEPWHAMIFSMVARIKSQGMRSGLAERAAWVIRPERPT
jgi:hypothetical protein